MEKFWDVETEYFKRKVDKKLGFQRPIIIGVNTVSTEKYTLNNE